jgi:hypothetical protein
MDGRPGQAIRVTTATPQGGQFFVASGGPFRMSLDSCPSADPRRADLRRADHSGANLYAAELAGADLAEVGWRPPGWPRRDPRRAGGARGAG